MSENRQLRDKRGEHMSAPVRGSLDRPDFRTTPEVDPGQVATEGAARAQASADRRAQAIERDQQRASTLPPSADSRLGALERRVQSLEADAIVMRARITELESLQPRKASVGRLRRQDGDAPPSAA